MSLIDELKERKKKTQGTTASTSTSGGLMSELNLRKKYQSLPVDDVDNNYIKTFVSDANSFLSGVGENKLSYADATGRLDDLGSRYDTIQGWLYQNKNKLDKNTYTKLSSSIGNLGNRFSDIKDFYRQFDSEDTYNTWYKNYSAQQKILNSEDFEKYSQIGASIKNPSYAAANRADNFLGWKNPFIDAPEIGNIVTYSRDNIDNITEELQMANNNGDVGSVLGDYRYQYLTDDEVSIYNYYLGKGDKETAAEYLASLDDVLNQRYGGKIAERVSGNALSELFFAAAAGLDQFASGIANLDNFFTGETSDAPTATQYASSQIRENIDGGKGVAYDLISTTANMLPSILVGSVTGGAGGVATMGASVVGNAYSEMRNLGYNEWQSRGYSALVGASETTLQYLLGGIGKLGGKLTGNVVSKITSSLDNAIAKTAITLGGNMLSEGLEEAVQEVLDPIFKKAMTGEDFEGIDLKQVLYSGLLGALSAGLLEGGPTIAGTVAYNSEAKQLYGENAQDLVTEALEIDPNNAYAQKLKTKLDNGKTLLGSQLDRLVQQNDSAIGANDIDTIKTATANRLVELGETGDVETIAAALTKQVQGEKLTHSEKKAIESSKFAQRVANELNIDNIKSGEYSSAWAESIGTDRINAEEYSRLLQSMEAEASAEAPTKATNETTAAETAQPVTETEQAPAVATQDDTGGTKTIHEAENVPAETNATEDKIFTPADKSSATIEVDGKDTRVKVEGISSVGNGSIMVRLDNGETVNVNEVNFGNEDVGLIYQAAADMCTPAGGFNADTVRIFATSFDPGAGLTASEYFNGFRNAYRYGAEGAPISELAKDLYASKLTEELRNRAFHFGRVFGNKKISATQTALDAKKAQATDYPTNNKDPKSTNIGDEAVVSKNNRTTKSESEKTSYYDGDRDLLTDRQRASVEFLELVFGDRGVKFIFFASYTDESGNRVYRNGGGKVVPAPNGFINPDGSIMIDLNAGESGEGLILNTASHELTHFIKDWSPAKFRIFAEFLLEQYGDRDISVEKVVQRKTSEAKEKGRTINREIAYEEIIADSCEMMLVDIVNNKNSENLQKLLAKDKSLFVKIKDFFVSLFKKIKEAYEGVEPQSFEGEYIRKMHDVADKLQTMWTDALVDATDAHKAISENRTKEGGVKLSDRDSDGNVLPEKQKAFFKNIRYSLRGTNEEGVEAYETSEEIKKLPYKERQKVFLDIMENEYRGRTAKFVRNGHAYYALFEERDVRKNIYGDKNSDNKGIKAKLNVGADGNIFELIENAKYDGSKPESGKTTSSHANVKYWDYFVKTVQIDNTVFDLVANVRKKPDNSFVYHIQLKENKKTKASPPRSSLLRASSGVPNASNNILSQNSENVNSKSSEKVDPENALTKEQADESDNIRYSDRDNFHELKRELKEKHGVDTDAIIAISDEYMQNYSGVLNKTQFRMQFLNLARVAINSTNDKDGEFLNRLNEMVFETASEIVNNPSIGGDLVDELREIKHHIKDTRIKIPSEKGDFDIYDGFETFRRKHFNRLTLTKDGIDVDSVYLELQELFGKGWFPDGIDTVPDQLVKIAEVANKPLSEVSEKYYDTDEIKVEAAGEIFNKIYPIAYNAAENRARINLRQAGGISPRVLLANALESVAQNDIERNKLKSYRVKIDELNLEEQKLQSLQKQIRELSFKNGPRNTQKIQALRDEAAKSANRISIYDRQLLDLQASKPIKAILRREKDKVYKKEAEKNRDALAKYREHAKKTQEELKRRYQESKKRGNENRRNTEMRHKIKSVVTELNHLLLHGSKNRNVKSGLQGAVAASLAAIDVDSAAQEERLAKYNELISKEIDKDVIASLIQTRANIQKQGDVIGDELEAMRKAYSDIRKKDVGGEYPDYLRAEAKLIENRIEAVINIVGNTPLRKMSFKQLDAVYNMYKMVLTTIRNANKVFKQGKLEDLQKNVNSVINELSAIPKLPEERSAVRDTWRNYAINNLTPYYAVSRIGSETFESLYWEAIKGQDVYARDLNEAKDFASKTREKYHYAAWDFDKIHKFNLADGRMFSVSLKHMMSIYAYSKRNQAKAHMQKGGFFFNDKETFRRKRGVMKMIRDSEAGYKIDNDTLAAVVSAMTEEQRQYVDAMQAYMTQMGEKGNEVSQVLWGTDLFKEKFYFPLKSSKDFIYQANQPAQEASLKNDGMTKETKPGASNPIVLEAFDDVWAAHINRMSQYHAFVLPIENLNKILNYGTWAETDSVAVSTMLRSRYGSAINDYLNQFIGDLNGVRNSQGAKVPAFSGMLTKFKKTTVAASLSVVIQQPTAILRAQALVDAKHFVHLPNIKNLSARWEEIKKYAPIAIIKEIGGFDAGSGQQIAEWMNADTHTGLKKVSNKIDDVAMFGAAKADQLGWCAIWEAVKRETLAKHQTLSPTSDEFKQLVGERFTEVIVKTQVYDSTLSRSGYMRSKNELTKMMTTFLGESTLNANMLYVSVIQAKRGKISKKEATRVIGAVYLATVAASIAKSFIYALRDDDEDESYLEKYFQALGGSILNDINPFTWLPGVRDVLSIFDGWEIERTDMALFQDLKNAFDGLGSDSKSTWRKSEDLAGAFASFLGLPLKNIMRTAREVYNGFENMVDGISGGKLDKAFFEGVTGKKKGRIEALYDAVIFRDTERLEVYRDDYENESAYDSALSKALRENDPRVKEAAEARYNGDIAEYIRIAKEIIGEGKFSQDNIVAAINAEMRALKKASETSTDNSEDQSGTDEAESMYHVDDFYMAIQNGDVSAAYAVKEDIVNVAIKNGENREEAEKAFKSSIVSYVEEQYKAEAIGDNEATNMLTKYGGKTEAEAASKVRYWAFKLEYPEYEYISESSLNKYHDGSYKDGELYGNSAASYGISLDIYAEYIRGKTGLTKKEDIMYIINTLPLTSRQKDALYYLNNWARSAIGEAPWH